MKTVAYLRVSTRSQDLANQKLAILEFSQKRRFPIDQFIESRISSRKSPLERRIDEMLGTLEPGDRLLVSELSRLGRSLSQVIQIVEALVRRKIRWAFGRGGAWRNPKPTGGPYVCEQCRLDACGENDRTLTMQAVTTIELAPADVCANCGARLLEKLEDAAAAFA